MMLEKVARYVLIVGVLVVAGGVGFAYWRATIQIVGDECPSLDAAPADVVFEDRVRTEQRLDLNYDLRAAIGGPALSCLNVLGQAKCQSDGPTVLAGQLGYRGEVQYWAIPEGRSAVVRLSNSRLLCVMPDP